MAATIVSKHKIHFGTGYSRILPDGWQLIESPEDWAIGKDPEGREYLLSWDKAYPIKKNSKQSTRGSSTEIFIDLENKAIDL